MAKPDLRNLEVKRQYIAERSTAALTNLRGAFGQEDGPRRFLKAVESLAFDRREVYEAVRDGLRGGGCDGEIRTMLIAMYATRRDGLWGL